MEFQIFDFLFDSFVLDLKTKVMIFPVFLGLFILMSSLQISGKESFKKEMSWFVFSKSVNLKVSSSFFKKERDKVLKPYKKAYFLVSSASYQDQIKNDQQKSQILNSRSHFSTKQDKTSQKIKTVLTNEMIFLKEFAQAKSSLEIHNKALNFLKNNQEEKAFLLLKRNVYQNFFFPSYLALFHFEVPIFFTPFLWHIGLIFLAFICLFPLILSFKEPTAFNLKVFFVCLSLAFTFSFSKIWILKNRVSSFQEMDLRSSPFREAPVKASLSPNSDLIVLKQTGDWLVVRSKDKQTGWLKKEDVFQIF